MKKLLLLLLLLSSLIMWGCYSSSGDTAEGGSGSEIVGDVAYAEGDSTGRAIGPWVKDGWIFIFKTDHEGKPQDNIPETYTNSNGQFYISKKNNGNYLIEANDNYGKAAIQYVTITGVDDTLELDNTMIVKKTSTLKYQIKTSIDISGVDVSYAIYLLGTRIYAKGDESVILQEASLDGIPYGTYSIKVVLTIEGITYPKTFNNITFDPGIDLSYLFEIN